MFNVGVNYENQKTVILNFEEMIEACPDILDRCEDAISIFKKKFNHLAESIDEPQDYYYVITCESEDEADDVEFYFENVFSQLEEELEEFDYDEAYAY